MMTAGYLLAILCLGLMYHHGMAVDECGCGVRHPQVRYCESSVAMFIQVHDKVETNLPFAKETYYKDYVRFNITILEVFKPKDDPVVESFKQQENTTLWTLSNFCGVPEMKIMDAYVISGYFEHLVDPSTGEDFPLLMMTRCGIHSKMGDVTDYQMTGFRGEYQKYCGDCRPADVYGELTHKRDSEEEFFLFPEAMTKFWTLDMECFFNPATAKHYLVRDCESEVSVCKRDPNTAKCAWEMSNDYLECYERRGNTVNFRKKDKNAAAAVRRPSDCKYLQNKKLKKKCLRNVVKKLRGKKRKNRHNRQD